MLFFLFNATLSCPRSNSLQHLIVPLPFFSLGSSDYDENDFEDDDEDESGKNPLLMDLLRIRAHKQFQE